MIVFAGGHTARILQARTLIQIDAQVTLGLALYARVVDGRDPPARAAVVHQLSVRDRGMVEVVGVQEEDPVAGILDHREAHRIGDPIQRQPRAAAGMAEITALAQGRVVRDNVLFAGMAEAAKPASQGKTMRKRPGDLVGSFPGMEVRTTHGDFILVPALPIV
jgi:hypothetical protein